MKWIKKLVLRLFNRWYEIDIKPIHISIDSFETESKEINKELISRIITKDDYKVSVGAYTNAKYATLALINYRLYIILDKDTEGVFVLQDLIHNNGLINIKEEVVKDSVKTKVYSEYEIKER